jgi:hypothetical protein
VAAPSLIGQAFVVSANLRLARISPDLEPSAQRSWGRFCHPVILRVMEAMRSDLLSRDMTGIALLAVLLAGCGFFTQPEIVYVKGKTVGVRYVNTGSRDLDTKAMQLLAKHCGEQGFRVTNRTVQVTHRNVSGEPTQITIDAVCL